MHMRRPIFLQSHITEVVEYLGCILNDRFDRKFAASLRACACA